MVQNVFFFFFIKTDFDFFQNSGQIMNAEWGGGKLLYNKLSDNKKKLQDFSQSSGQIFNLFRVLALSLLKSFNFFRTLLIVRKILEVKKNVRMICRAFRIYFYFIASLKIRLPLG